ncbi:MAG: hypothetical protein NTY03_02205 [Candidatus Bathyarchaeota archaeon]|jgi:hypothetical protein|nr:hypothetical protein [Candidatus Bathyarchaeota archaeon]
MEKGTRIFMNSETVAELRQQAKADKLSISECAEELLKYAMWFLNQK